MAQEVAFRLTGERQSNIDYDAFVRAYQAQETAFQQQQIAGAATVTSPQNPESLAEDIVRETMPDQVQARGFVDKAGTLLKMLDDGLV